MIQEIFFGALCLWAAGVLTLMVYETVQEIQNMRKQDCKDDGDEQ